MAIAYLWKVDGDEYRFHVNKISAKEKRSILMHFKTWNETGSGYHKDGTETFIFSKILSAADNIYKFAKQLPFTVVEEKKNGEIKIIKAVSLDAKTKKGLTNSVKPAKTKGGRTCSHCGQKGHNSRTCKNDLSQ